VYGRHVEAVDNGEVRLDVDLGWVRRVSVFGDAEL
jgi:hypothetical protein